MCAYYVIVAFISSKVENEENNKTDILIYKNSITYNNGFKI